MLEDKKERKRRWKQIYSRGGSEPAGEPAVSL